MLHWWGNERCWWEISPPLYMLKKPCRPMIHVFMSRLSQTVQILSYQIRSARHRKIHKDLLQYTPYYQTLIFWNFHTLPLSGDDLSTYNSWHSFKIFSFTLNPVLSGALAEERAFPWPVGILNQIKKESFDCNRSKLKPVRYHVLTYH